MESWGMYMGAADAAGGDDDGGSSPEEFDIGNCSSVKQLEQHASQLQREIEEHRECVRIKTEQFDRARERIGQVKAEQAERRRAARRRCSADGCDNFATRGGVCVRHGASRRKCSHEGCARNAQNNGLCSRHGARIHCTVEGCNKHVRKGGLCGEHALEMLGRSCSVEGCNKLPKSGGMCLMHAGVRQMGGKRTCKFEGCDKWEVGQGLCTSHGGTRKPWRRPRAKGDGDDDADDDAEDGTPARKVPKRCCNFEGCEKWPIGGGFCRSHGGTRKRPQKREGEGSPGVPLAPELPPLPAAGVDQDDESGAENEDGEGADPDADDDDGNEAVDSAGDGAGDERPPQKRKRTKNCCKFEGCTKWQQGGGFCRRHGKREDPQTEDTEGNSRAEGGDTDRGDNVGAEDDAGDGAGDGRPPKKRKYSKRCCNFEGCAKWPVGGGFCRSHGGTRKKSRMKRAEEFSGTEDEDEGVDQGNHKDDAGDDVDDGDSHRLLV